MGDYLKKAYLTLVKKDKGNHDGESDLSSNGDLVFALAMQNYNKAHKLKSKANKKQQKMLLVRPVQHLSSHLIPVSDNLLFQVMSIIFHLYHRPCL
jgi:hypothetical protein